MRMGEGRPERFCVWGSTLLYNKSTSARRVVPDWSVFLAVYKGRACVSQASVFASVCVSCHSLGGGMAGAVGRGVCPRVACFCTYGRRDTFAASFV